MYPTLSVFNKCLALNKSASNERLSPGPLINDRNVGKAHTFIFKKNLSKDCELNIYYKCQAKIKLKSGKLLSKIHLYFP